MSIKIIVKFFLLSTFQARKQAKKKKKRKKENKIQDLSASDFQKPDSLQVFSFYVIPIL